MTPDEMGLAERCHTDSCDHLDAARAESETDPREAQDAAKAQARVGLRVGRGTLGDGARGARLPRHREGGLMGGRAWIWFGTTSHRVTGLGNSFRPYKDRYEFEGKPVPDWVPDFVTCRTRCGIDVQVHTPPGSSLADACQPKGRPACPACEGEDR